MNAETTKVMQEALQAAVTRMNNGSAESPGLPMDTMGAVMSVLPKLLQNSGSSEEMLEKLDTMQKGDLTSLRGQVQILRKQCYRMLKSQEQLLTRVHDIQRQQSDVARAVLDLAQQMARLTFIDNVSDEDDFDRDDTHPPERNRRVESRTHRDGRGRSQREM